MTASQLSLSGPKHFNRGLFSDYYLSKVIPERADWLPMTSDASSVYEALRNHLAQINPELLDEAQLENQWVQFVLEQLGLHYSVQVKIRYQTTGYRKPDYGLTQTADQVHAITNQIYSPDELQKLGLIAVADAKKWGTPFDQAAPGQRNPSQQIDEYLRYSELPWGILTDGRTWRLYGRDSSKNNVYYAVDLAGLLEQDDIEAFLYFYAFFRQEAFTTGWLEQVKTGSEAYAQGVSDQLEGQVYEALELIAQGFLNYRRNALETTPETLKAIYENSLVLLYRILFVLYAESREILPLNRNDAYTRSLSLEAIKKEVAPLHFSALDSDKSDYYVKLKDLFFNIDKGSAFYNLPAYNGRLFSAEQHPFLDKYFAGDRYLAPAIDKMARVEQKDDRGQVKRVLVDYRDLEVHHLGTIYEKLLEYQLDVATEPLSVKEDKFVPAKAGEKTDKRKGEVYLRTGSNQRKVTGSYYTPDYIVRFIVERTLEPLLFEITERYATMNAEGHWQVNEPEKLRDEILALNVLDPATGSGHFLVDVTAYIAEWLRSLALIPADLKGDDDELRYWKRQVVSACIYGVDRNPLAVELAKLSLWLATLSRGKPLSFLDHHIRYGDSLVGARGAAIGVFDEQAGLNGNGKRRKNKKNEPKEASQLPIFSEGDFAPAVSSAIEQMSGIEHTVVERVDQVKIQEEMYATLTENLSTWQHIANVWLAQRFGVSFEKSSWDTLEKYLRGELMNVPPALKKLVEQSERIAGEFAFFHWELVFPEIFFEPDGKVKAAPGFDAVVGNPPYVRQELIKPIKPFLKAQYDEIYTGTADLFLYFYEQCLRLLKPDKRLGFITSGTYMNSKSASRFRPYINKTASYEVVLNFGENQPFKGAEMVYPTISILRKGKPGKTFRSLFIEKPLRHSANDKEFVEAVSDFDSTAIDCLSDVTGMKEWRFQPAELTELFRKITGKHSTLADKTQKQIYSGIKTGFAKAFIVDTTTKERLITQHVSSAEIIRPIRRGEDLRSWYQIDGQQYLILSIIGINIDGYPAVKQYLEGYHSALKKRSEVVDGGCKWYELRPCDYYDKFSQPKIFWAEIAKIPRFSWDETGLFCNNKGHIVVPDGPNVLALLNSRVLWFAMSQICVPLRLRGGLWQYQLTKQFVERLPIPTLTSKQESELAEIVEQITVNARERYQLHENMRQRLSLDLVHGGNLSKRLKTWWLLKDVSALREELQRVFKSDIALAERDEWAKYLLGRKAEHTKITAEIIRLETRMNSIVYAAFKLTPDEIALIERTTKYPYGAV